MNVKARTPEETYERALQKARAALADITPQETAARTGVSYHPHIAEGGQFQVRFFERNYQVSWPQGGVQTADSQQEPDVATRLLLLHYLLTADGTPLADRWIAFRNLPGGLGYDAAFQGRANLRLARAFGADRTAFEAAAQAIGAERLSFGDASFAFRVLPQLWLAVVLYLADDEFPASANVLFDATASHYLPTEDLAVLGGILAGTLTKKAR